MPRYAYFNHALPSPQRVLGWLDTDAVTYPTMLDEADLVELTDNEWAWRLSQPSGWYIEDGILAHLDVTPPPDQIAAVTLADKIADGIAITSLSNPEVNCTMALDQLTMEQIGSVARDAASGMGLPAGSNVFIYPDINGLPRRFSEAQIIGLYKAQRDLLFALNTQAAIASNGGEPDWPPQTGTIP